MAMTVRARLKRPTGGFRRQRPGHDPHAVARAGGQAGDAYAQLRRAREAGRSQDEALYRCQCGFVFQAPVSTSVGCPHCGDTQAW
jgi:predicted Zn-ribbon and HTH transcriptional regulator